MFQPCKAWYLYLMLVLMMTLAPVVGLISDFCHIARSNFLLLLIRRMQQQQRQRTSMGGGDDEDGMIREWKNGGTVEARAINRDNKHLNHPHLFWGQAACGSSSYNQGLYYLTTPTTPCAKARPTTYGRSSKP